MCLLGQEGDNMPKVIEQKKSGLTTGIAALGNWGGKPGTVKQEVHDGDAVTVQTRGNFGVRLLGVDAPEISFTLPGRKGFTYLHNEDWETFLCDPFAEAFPFTKEVNPIDLDPGLHDYLQRKVGPGTAMNQHQHADKAENELEKEISKDLEVLGQSRADFRFFLAFAHEVMDRYGRFLCFINRHQPDEHEPEKCPPTYNERLLEKGLVSPYFIWPNINPFRRKKPLTNAVLDPDAIRKDKTLAIAREWVLQARKGGRGIFDTENCLKLLPFEVRFLARRRPPDRWVIDLTKDDKVLINPQQYYTIPNVEDRLFVPAEYVPLFVKEGWKEQ